MSNVGYMQSTLVRRSVLFSIQDGHIYMRGAILRPVLTLPYSTNPNPKPQPNSAHLLLCANLGCINSIIIIIIIINF